MDKRAFIKNSSLLAAGAACTPIISCSIQKPLSNWAGNLTYSTNSVAYPTTTEAVRQVVRGSQKIRGLGSRHSFNTIADSQFRQISLERLRKINAVNKQDQTITIEGGVRYGDICQPLDDQGFALHNLASLPHISVAGACATATHGSGVDNGGLAIAVTGLIIVKANGDIIELSKEKDQDLLEGLAVSLGAFGVITKVTLKVLPTYKMKQVVYRNMPMSSLEDNFETIMSSGYSVSLFTDWSKKNINEVWIKQKSADQRTGFDKDFFGGTIADKNLHPVESLSAESCTEQMGVEGSWYERLPHFKMGFTPSSGDELQAEYFVPFEHGFQAIELIEKMNSLITPHLFISEIRSIAPDNLWMSPCYKQPSIAIHFTFKPQKEAVQKILPQIEDALSPFNVRPHWGKLFAMSPDILRKRIRKIKDWKSLVQEFDPNGKFRNEFMNKNIFS